MGAAGSSIVGIGPGDAAWRTPEASAAVAAASDIVGYGLYLDLLGPAIAGKTRHDRDARRREERARHALELAGGQDTWRWSGRAMPESTPWPRWCSSCSIARGGAIGAAVEIAVPRDLGRAGRRRPAGALLGHDFCAISLSDLLTPWPAITRRLEAAAAADFVTALYNPRSSAAPDLH